MAKHYLNVPDASFLENAFSFKKTEKVSESARTSQDVMIDRIKEPYPLTPDQVKEALGDSITNKWCISFRDDPLKGINLHEINSESVFRYELESLIETRTVSKKIELYDGKPIDGRENGAVPDVWDAPVIPPGNFMEGEITYLIPHSEEVHSCASCEGEGKVYCSKCRGHGRRRLSGQIVFNPDEKPAYLEKP